MRFTKIGKAGVDLPCERAFDLQLAAGRADV
jgi:hypothetical protein